MRNKRQNTDISERYEKIKDLIMKTPTITQQELAKKLYVDQATISRDFRKLNITYDSDSQRYLLPEQERLVRAEKQLRNALIEYNAEPSILNYSVIKIKIHNQFLMPTHLGSTIVDFLSKKYNIDEFDVWVGFHGNIFLAVPINLLEKVKSDLKTLLRS